MVTSFLKKSYSDWNPNELENYIDFEFFSFLKNQGFILTKIQGDGNCMFRAIADLVVNNEDKHKHYRELAVQYISLKKEHFQSFLTTNEGSIQQYLDTMSKNAVWGGHIELLALSAALNRSIYVYNDKQECNIIKNQSPSNSTSIPALHLAFDTTRFHYSSLRLSEKFNHDERREKENEAEIIKVGKRKWKDLKFLYNKTLNTNAFSQNDEKLKLAENKKGKEKRKIKKISSIEECFDSDKIDFKEIFCKSNEELIIWCVKVGIIKKPSYCKNCRSRVGKINRYRLTATERYLDLYAWKCQDKNCRDTQWIRTGSRLLEAFPKVKLRILLIYIFNHFCFLISAKDSREMLGLNFKTIRSISALLTQWVVSYQKLDELFRGKIGGKTKIVELDESCFFKRKSNKGRVMEQVWVFGAVERNSNKLLVEIVENRKAVTLLPIIQKWVSKDTDFIVTDEWRSYKRLGKLGFNHKVINHSKNFVHADDALVHTQTIENRWGQIKAIMKKRGRISRVSFAEKLKEITWRLLNRNTIQNSLLKIIIQYNNY